MAISVRLTAAQALLRFLKVQLIERDGDRHPFFAGIWGIFGHGNVAGLGEALEQDRDLPFFLVRNEQAAVHIAAAFAKQQRRLRCYACTSSIGPGATNMITGAAGATINRLPVLLLPGDIFARRNVAPVLQQLEHPLSPDISVNDCFKPISRFWDRIERAEQILFSLPEAVRVLTDPAETGAVTIALPQDVQAESFDYPLRFFEQRVHHQPRTVPDPWFLKKAVEMIMAAKRPLIVAGGGVLYSAAEGALERFCALTGIPVGETQSGKGALSFENEANCGAIGATGTLAANILAQSADLVLALGTRLSDFTTASKTLFQDEQVRFISININPMDAAKHGGLPLVGDLRATLDLLSDILVEEQYAIDRKYREEIEKYRRQWFEERERICSVESSKGFGQARIIEIVGNRLAPEDTVVAAAGSLPGDLHKLFKVRNGDQYHVEYGFSCMGYEIAGGLGVRLAKTAGEVVVLVGDGSYLMMHTELVTALQEHCKLIVILIDNHGFASIDGLSRSCGSSGFANRFHFRNPLTGNLDGEILPIDFAANAASYGAKVFSVGSEEEFHLALKAAYSAKTTTVIVARTDSEQKTPSYHSWWDVPIAENSTAPKVNEARKGYEQKRKYQRYHL